MQKKDVVAFVKTHKKEIIVAVSAVVIGSVVFAITKRKPPVPAAIKHLCKDIPIPEIGVGVISCLWREQHGNGRSYLNAIVEGLTVADLGRFGEELTKIEGVEPTTTVSAIIGLA